MENIGILTSGGDAPGMNSVIYAVVKSAMIRNTKVYGFLEGYKGLISGNAKILDMELIDGINSYGGTILKTSRCQEFLKDAERKKAKEICEKFKIDGLIIVGGNGSFAGAIELAKLGVHCIGIPSTIDNDIRSTEYAIGFDTAINTATKMIDSLMDTVRSLDRCMIAVVMGRNSGEIALRTSLATGADFVLLPKSNSNSEEKLIKKIKRSKEQGFSGFLIVMAEGYPNEKNIIKKIKDETGNTVKVSVLGYVQRGGSPTAKDRIIGNKMGVKAVELLYVGKFNRIISYLNGGITSLKMEDIFKAQHSIVKSEIELFVNGLN